MAGLVEIEGIGQVYAEKLAVAGLKTTEALLSGRNQEGKDGSRCHHRD